MDITIHLSGGLNYDLFDIETDWALAIRDKYLAGEPFTVLDVEDGALLIIRPEHAIALELRADEDENLAGDPLDPPLVPDPRPAK